jgi:hypothetical protein
MELQAKVKLNPVRIRVPKYGNGLMLLMEKASRYSGGLGSFLGHVTEQEYYFDIEIRGTKDVAQSVKKYINNNL